MIVLDAGHGGGDPGCVGNGMKEADLTLDICERIKKRLERYQVVVSIAPRGELSERVKYANCCYAELFLSIHVNVGGGTGFESYVYPEVGTRTRKLRDKIHDTIMEYLSLVNVADRGKKEKNFHVLRETKMSAILLECLFIDHAQDAEKLASELFRDQLANEIAWALVQALELEKVIDPCVNCQKLQEMASEKSKLSIDNSRLRQIVNNAKRILSNVN
ncbi:MAG: N-acetylmuramoyl-L-alanine amidase [Bacteroidales bacterium]|nr:N-acetylmuramoyl-L-alanine amidase [Bacteroidales bacterium]